MARTLAHISVPASLAGRSLHLLGYCSVCGAGWRCRSPRYCCRPRFSRPVSAPADIIQHILAQREGVEPSQAYQPGCRFPSGPVTVPTTLHDHGAERRCRPPWLFSHPQFSKLVPEPSGIVRQMAPIKGLEPFPSGSKPDVLPLHKIGMVREAGYDPACFSKHQGLSLARLPIPALSQMVPAQGLEP